VLQLGRPEAQRPADERPRLAEQPVARAEGGTDEQREADECDDRNGIDDDRPDEDHG
jgi:hypothetical protein